jgi:hypothetical protein
MKKVAIIAVLLGAAALWLIAPTSPISPDSDRHPSEVASSVSPAPHVTQRADPSERREAIDGRSDSAPTPSAPTSPPATPTTFREALARRVAAFRESGPAPADLAAVGAAALAALSADRMVIESGCFRAGCLVTLKVNEREAAAVAAIMEANGSAAGRWPGPRQRLEPIPLQDGASQVTWLLHAP